MKMTPMARLAIDPDFASLHFNELLADSKAEARALTHSRGCVADLIELVEDTLTFRRGNAQSRVGNGDLYVVSVLECSYSYFTTRIGELYGIAE